MSLAELKEVKEYGRTAIPTGRYPIAYTYSPRFKKHLPLLLQVPAFEGIRIHAGNTHRDTSGCLLLGKNKAVGKVLDSRKTMDEFLRILKPAIEACEDIWITIK
jgi:hypothetical protein